MLILLACWAEALGTKRVLLQSNHGPMICAESMEVAFDYLVSSMLLTLYCSLAVLSHNLPRPLASVTCVLVAPHLVMCVAMADH